MRKLILIALVTLLSSCSSNPKGNTKSESSIPVPSALSSPYPKSSKASIDYFVSDVYGPFNVGDPDFDATFSYRANISNQQIIESIEICPFSSGSPYATINHAPFYYQDNALIETTFTIPIHHYLTNKGLTLKFELLSYPSREVLKSYETKFFPNVQPGWTAEELKKGFYFTKYIGFYGSGQALSPVTETFNFKYIGDFIDNNYYYRLDLANNYITYDSLFDLSYEAINLKFEDRDYVFRYFSHDSNDNVILPIKAKLDSNDKVSFIFKNPLFVNKDTLDMSDSRRAGYVRTGYFYLPINKRDLLDEKAFTLEFVNFGKCKLNASFPLEYITGNSLVGTAGSSKYHVVGGVK